MIVVTAANRAYRKAVVRCRRKARAFGLDCHIYDLGNLGLGTPWEVTNHTFQSNGYYCTVGSWRTRALHKPGIVLDALLKYPDQDILYLDADAELVGPWPDVAADLAVTVRRPDEAAARTKEEATMMGEVNAGVIYFANRPAVHDFVRRWGEETALVRNDQLALNRLVGTGLPRDGWANRSGVDVRCLPTDLYNFYYFSEQVRPETVVVHYKNRAWDDPFSTSLSDLLLRYGRAVQAPLDLARPALDAAVAAYDAEATPEVAEAVGIGSAILRTGRDFFRQDRAKYFAPARPLEVCVEVKNVLDATRLREGRVLDIGSGYGQHSALLADMGFHTTGLLPPDHTADFREGHGALGLPFVQHQLPARLPFRRRAFDLCVASKVITLRAMEKHQYEIVDEMSRVARFGYAVFHAKQLDGRKPESFVPGRKVLAAGGNWVAWKA